MIEIKKLTADEEDNIIKELFKKEIDFNKMAIVANTVIDNLLRCGCEPMAFVTRDPEGLASDLERWHESWPDVPIYEMSFEKYCESIGITKTHGVFAIMKANNFCDCHKLLKDGKKILVLDVDPQHVKEMEEALKITAAGGERIADSSIGKTAGTSVRTAAALGVDAILITETTRKLIDYLFLRQCTGNLFRVPAAIIPDFDKGGMELLKKYGFHTFSVDLQGNVSSVPLSKVRFDEKPKQAMILQDRKHITETDARISVDFPVKHNQIPLITSMTSVLWEFLK